MYPEEASPPVSRLRRHGRTVLALGVLCLAVVSANAAEGERIGLVLGGGGARGAAHIGVLKVLERERIPVHAIAGTSIGAIVGALYASGQSPEEIEAAFTSIDWREIFRDGTARVDQPMRQKETDLGILANLEIGLNKGKLSIPTTLVRGQKLGLLLRRLFLGRANVQNFDDLPIPFRSVATDIGVVRPVVFSSGDLVLAVRASMAVPGGFAPVHHDGKVLVDGGIVNNVPIDVARAMGVDRLIVVDVGSPTLPAESIDGSFDILLQMVTGLMRDRTEEQLKSLTSRDLLLRPDLPELSAIDFPGAVEGIGPGEQSAMAVVDQLRTFALSESAYGAWREHQRQPYQPPATVDFVTVVADQSATAGFVRDRITLRAGDELDMTTLDRDIAGAFGRGTYDSISYHLTTDPAGRTGVEIVPVDSGLGRTVFRAGLQISDDFAGSDGYQLNVESRVTGLNDKGAEWRTFLGLGRVTSLLTDFYLPFGQRGNWFLSPEAGHTALTQPFYLEGDSVAEYRVGSWQGGVRIGRDFGDRFRLAAGVTRGQDHGRARVADPLLPRSLTSDIGGVVASALYDSLDNVRFPRSGMRAELGYSVFTQGLGSDTDGNLLRVAIDKAISRGRNTLMVGARASLSKDRVDAYQTESSLGGLTYLSGLGDRELLGEQMLLLRAVEYHRLTQEGLLFDLPLYIAGSLEAGNVWDDYDDVSLGDLIGAASVFIGIDLPVGPLQLGYGRTFDGRDSFYLTFGSLVLPRYR